MSLHYDLRDAGERGRGLAAAAPACRRGDLVVLPTETVYAVATDAFSAGGVSRVHEAKGRGGVSLPVMVPGPGTVDGLAVLSTDARRLIEAFWPGELTILVHHHASLSWTVGDEAGRVALRMPLHPAALELLRDTGPLAVTSANRSGLPAPSTVGGAEAQLGDAVWIYLDGGECEPGPPSTIVDVTGEVPVLVREGAFGLDVLRSVCPGLQTP